MKNEHNKNLDRRDFLKVLGGAAAVTSATLLPGCKNKQESAYTATTDIPTDQMTYRINPSTQDRVSLLGYGCMRWPTVSNNSARDSSDDIDQETVNKLVDVAIAHGVNYFDTSPAYCKGRSERATGIALSRYPRDKYFIATKLSNFAPSTWSREASIAMYHNSFKELQVNYIDYLLLHGVGMGNRITGVNAVTSTTGSSISSSPNDKPDEYGTSDFLTTETSRYSTIFFPATMNSNGTSYRYNSIMSIGSMPKK